MILNVPKIYKKIFQKYLKYRKKAEIYIFRENIWLNFNDRLNKIGEIKTNYKISLIYNKDIFAK